MYNNPFNFNPFSNNFSTFGQFGQNMGHNASFLNRSLPFTTPGATKIAKGLTTGKALSGAGKKLSLGGILDGTQKTVGTINQMLPIYNQVKPLLGNSKILLNIGKMMKSEGRGKKNFVNRGMQYQNQYTNNNDNKVIDIPAKEKKETFEDPKFSFPPANKPSKPYFPD